MDCNELIMSEEIQDFIIEYNLTELNLENISEEVCFQQVNEDWQIGYARLPAEYGMNISELGYQTVPKLYGLMDSTSMDASGITATLNQPYLDVTGQGVIVGFIDTGIDYNLDVFKESPVASRIGVIWDQTIQTQEEERSDDERRLREELGGGFRYGTMYTKERIDEALRVAFGGGDSYEIVPSRDENGHGTFVAGIAAGGSTESGIGAGGAAAQQDAQPGIGRELSDFTGAAPRAEIAMVKLKPAKQYLRDYYLINDDAVAYQENDIMLGVSFLLRYAGLRGLPLVICLGVGTGSGPRTGSTPLGSVLADAADITGVVVVTAIGNEANGRLHTFGRINSLEEAALVEINVGEGERGFVLEIWASTLDVLSVSIVSPSGETIPRIPARQGSSNIFRFILEGTEVAVDYRVVERQSGYELIFMRFDAPTPGIWRIEVYSLTNIQGVYNAWLPLKQFLSSDTFLLGASPFITLVEPSAVVPVITVGAYDHVTGAAYADSSRGFTAQGQVKPDIVAPGVNVYGPAVGGGYTYRSGTSVAAAHVAGASALLLSWGVTKGYMPFIGTSAVKYLLIRGATRDGNQSYPDRILGYGKLNLIESFTQMRVT